MCSYRRKKGKYKICEHLFFFSPHTFRNPEYLCVLEGVHDEDGEAQSKDVGKEAGVEIRSAVLLQTAGGGKDSKRYSSALRSNRRQGGGRSTDLTSKRRSKAMKIPGMTMSPRPSMAKLFA